MWKEDHENNQNEDNIIFQWYTLYLIKGNIKFSYSIIENNSEKVNQKSN